MRKVFISDYTLALSQSVGNNSLLFREKMAIAACCDEFGADSIELGSVKNAKEDEIIFRTICSKIQNAGICVNVGLKTESIDIAYNCIKDAVKPCLQIALPVSTVRMEYLFHMKSDKLLNKIKELCAYAHEKGCEVEFVAEDASRSSLDFLNLACRTAVDSGADRVTICDDAGIYMPEDIFNTVTALKSQLNCPIYVKVSDFASLGVATAIAAIKGGADGVKGVITGEDALLIKNFAFLVRKKGKDLEISTGLDDTKLYSDIRELTKQTVHLETSDNAEMGEDILLTASTDLDELKKATVFLGYSLSVEDCGKVYNAVQRVCTKKNCIGAKELEAIIATHAQQAPSTYHLDNYLTTSSNITTAVSQIALKYNDSIINGVAQGDGPIDSAFKAIEQAIGFHYELDDFQIQSVTEGKEALGTALVRLRSNGKLYSGNGISTDIVAASIRAYLNALNKIVFDE